MYLTRTMDYFSGVPKMELIVWGLTVGRSVSANLTIVRQIRSARSKAGNIKPGSTGPRIWTGLALAGQLGGFLLPQLVYWTTTAYNGFHQPEWMRKHALPSPPDVFGIDGVVAGRVVGLLASHAGMVLTRTAIIFLGDQYSPIGASTLFYQGLPDTDRQFGPSLCYSGSIVIGASFALVYWSYLPFYALFFIFSSTMLKIQIEERTIVEDPVLGDQYKRYKIKVPYRLIPYIW